MGNYLLIDTSSSKAQIALADENKIIVQKIWDSYHDLSDKLLPNIEKLLLSCHSGDKRRPESDSGQAGMTVNDLSGIIVYLGPGTFTGLRIGITVANAFVYSFSIPIVGVKGKSFGKEKFEIKNLKPIDLNELLKKGLREIREKKKSKFAVPFYGKKPNIGR